MRYSITARVESNGIIAHDASFPIEHGTLFVEKDSSGFIASIRLEVYVADFEKILPTISIGEDGSPHIRIPENPYDYLLEGLLQKLESFGSFWAEIKKIHWEECKREFKPDNEEERRVLSLTSFQATRQKPPPIVVPMEHIQELVNLPSTYDYLIIPMGFYREAVNDFEDHRYIDAFCKFYYFLEGLYGQGKWRNFEVGEKFKRSVHIQRAVKESISTLKEPSSNDHLRRIEERLKTYDLSFDIDGLIDYIVQERGNVHHFDIGAVSTKFHPMNQRDFEPTAFLIFSIATKTYVQLVDGSAPC